MPGCRVQTETFADCWMANSSAIPTGWRRRGA